MFKQFFSTLLVPLIFLGAGCSTASEIGVNPVTQEEEQEEVAMVEVVFEDGSYRLNAADSLIAWSAQKRVGSKHNGTVTAQEGAFVVEQGTIIGGTIVVNMATITDLDLTDAGMNAKLVEHLKSDDFFAAETYPTSTFAISEIVKVEGIQGATHRVTGMMTIKGLENEISFPAKFETSDTGISMTGTVTLDRTLWDVRYGSGKFFENLGDSLIEDEFILTLDVFFTAIE